MIVKFNIIVQQKAWGIDIPFVFYCKTNNYYLPAVHSLVYYLITKQRLIPLNSMLHTGSRFDGST